jgi:hypothetical protein
MIAYEVTVHVEERLVADFERYMRGTHIPQVLATGCFQGAVFSRAADGRYRTSYLAPSQAELDRYLQTYTPALREDFAARFPEGISLSRETWVALEQWGGAPEVGVH